METVTYRTNRILGFVITLMLFAIIFSIDIDQLKSFYQDPQLFLLIVFALIVMPTILLFGFSIQLYKDKVVYRHNVFFRKVFQIDEISQVLYQPTWRAVTPLNSPTTMRSLHVVRNTGGWRETISVANGAFREEDLANLADRLKKVNPKVELDKYTEALIKKYEHQS